MIHIKYSVGGELYGYPRPAERRTSGFQSKLSLIARDKNDKTEAILLWACHEKAGFLGKDTNAGKAEGSRKRGKSRFEME